MAPKVWKLRVLERGGSDVALLCSSVGIHLCRRCARPSCEIDEAMGRDNWSVRCADVAVMGRSYHCCIACDLGIHATWLIRQSPLKDFALLRKTDISAKGVIGYRRALERACETQHVTG